MYSRIEINKKFIAKITSLKSKDPQTYWNIINSKNKSSKDTVKEIRLEILVDHFKKLNKADNIGNTNIQDSNLQDEFLNKPFTVEELSDTVKKL